MVHANTFRENLWGHTCEKSCKFARATRRDTLSVRSICTQTEQMLSAVASSRRLRSAKSKPVPGLSADFKDHKPTKGQGQAARTASKHQEAQALKVLNSFNLQVECFIDDAWHPATIKGGGPFGKFLPGYEYTVIYNEDQYQENRVYDEYMRIPA